MVRLRDAADRVDERAPGRALACEHPAALAGEAVVPPAALACLLQPLALDPGALLEAIEQRVQRRDVEFQPAVRSRVDELADLIAMPGPCLDEREDQQLRRSLLQLPVEHPLVYISHSHILHRLRRWLMGFRWFCRRCVCQTRTGYHESLFPTSIGSRPWGAASLSGRSFSSYPRASSPPRSRPRRRTAPASSRAAWWTRNRSNRWPVSSCNWDRRMRRQVRRGRTGS